MGTFKYPLVAFCGYARSGKDTAAKTLINSGYTRVAFGDIIKRQLDPLIQEHLSFSAHTEHTAQKATIRRTLESWGEDAYDKIFEEFFRVLPPVAVNTRLCRVKEAKEWVARGGIIVRVSRVGCYPETNWAAERMLELEDSGLIHSVLHNDGTPEDLDGAVRRLYLDPATCYEQN